MTPHPWFPLVLLEEAVDPADPAEDTELLGVGIPLCC